MDPLSGLFFRGSEENLPPVVSSFFWTVQKVHQFWRYGFDVQRITQSSQNTYAYFAGFTMQKMGLADGATGIPIKWLAQLAFAMDTASRVSFQIERVNYVYHKLCDTLTGRNPAIR
ncbi:MAG: hypothetical protein KDK48_00005, partial [Chlamydiia bacterium]|nr:hypothetical protein [Chlamydiia bacterium]